METATNNTIKIKYEDFSNAIDQAVNEAQNSGFHGWSVTIFAEEDGTLSVGGPFSQNTSFRNDTIVLGSVDCWNDHDVRAWDPEIELTEDGEIDLTTEELEDAREEFKDFYAGKLREEWRGHFDMMRKNQEEAVQHFEII